jgi:hypothetical protein
MATLSRGKKIIGILSVAVLLVLVSVFVFRDRIDAIVDARKQAQIREELPAAQPVDSFQPESEPVQEDVVVLEDEPVVEPQPETLPEEINLRVPFTSQAPYGDWSLPYQEACEEASALMVHAFYEGAQLPREEAKRQILEVVDFQTRQYGFYKDSDVEQTAQFIRELWGYESVRVLEASADQIRRELANGKPVIIPAAGQQLGNPNFTGAGPVYHMLVVKGYTKNGGFITNDPGTRNGENYVYTESVLMNAIHDWNDGNVTQGAKVMIVIDPR